MLEQTGQQRERAHAAVSRRQDAVWWALLAAVALLALAAVLGRHEVARSWEGMGWWHWGPPVLCALAGAVALGLRRPGAKAPGRWSAAVPPAPSALTGSAAPVAPARPHGAEDGAGVGAADHAVEGRRAPSGPGGVPEGKTPRQLVGAVVRALGADGWLEARLDPFDPAATLVVARRGGATLLVRCHHQPGVRVTAAEVAELVGARASYPGAEAVIASSAGATPAALEAARGFGVELLAPERLGRWLAEHAAAPPVAADAG
ncbi:restriction endonuclease [Quadrisphaera sp. KR29]|uniref:restriction endonuclease n=1 Tax=Quadrisphaera sp. KR29 TaxID=3461391 RepID=UPI00404466BE